LAGFAGARCGYRDRGWLGRHYFSEPDAVLIKQAVFGCRYHGDAVEASIGAEIIMGTLPPAQTVRAIFE
jgi:hypothetical protein